MLPNGNFYFIINTANSSHLFCLDSLQLKHCNISKTAIEHQKYSYFLQIKASDQDCGANGTVIYSLEKADTDTFEIDSSSGKLCLRQIGYGDEKSK